MAASKPTSTESNRQGSSNEKSTLSKLLENQHLLRFVSEFITQFLYKLDKYHMHIQNVNNYPVSDFVKTVIKVGSKIAGSQINMPVSKMLGKGITTALNTVNGLYYRTKAIKVHKPFSIISVSGNGSRLSKLDQERCILAAVILACDICRMYQQQILIIDGGRSFGLYIALLAYDCVDRIIDYVHKRQGRYGSLSRFWDKIITNSSTREKRNQRLKDLSYNDEEMERTKKIDKLTRYLIEGLWMNSARSKTILRWVSGHQIHVWIEDPSEPGRKDPDETTTLLPNDGSNKATTSYSPPQKFKVTSKSLLERTPVQHTDGNYYGAKADYNYLRYVFGHPRMINPAEDKLLKQCGYRLTSLIDPSFTVQKTGLKKLENPSVTAAIKNVNILDELKDFEDLKTLAKELIEYFRNNSEIIQ